MRKNILILCSILLANQLFAEKIIERDDFSFSLPDFVEEITEYTVRPNVTCRIFSGPLENRFKSGVSGYRSDAARSLIDLGRPVTQEDVLKKLNSNDKFVLMDDFSMSGILLETYRKIKVGETIIGEMVAYGVYDGSIYDEVFAYNIRFIFNNTSYNIALESAVNSENNFDELKCYDDFLYTEDDERWFFNTVEDGKKFHELIVTSNAHSPQLFLELNVTLRWLLDTLKINNQSIEVVSPDTAFFADIQGRVGNEYIEVPDSYPYTNLVVGTINDDRLRVRTEPRTGETLGHVNTNDRVIILGRTGAVETIDNLTSYWYNIKFGQQEGWIFGGYVDVEQRDKDLIAAVR